MKQKITPKIFILFTLSLLVFGLALWWLFWEKKLGKLSQTSPTDSKSSLTWERLQSRPEVLLKEGYPGDLREYLEIRLGEERFLWSGDREKTYAKIQREYPGEQGQVLYAIYVAYSFWKQENDRILTNPNLSDYEKLTETKRLQSEIFPNGIQKILFPSSPLSQSTLLLASLQKFAAEKPGTYARERLLFFRKERVKLYKSSSETPWEGEPFWNSVTAIIYARELSLMEGEEREVFLREQREALQQDFWN